MKNFLIVVLLTFLYSITFDISHANEEKFQYKITSGLLWKTIGKEKIEPKYQGFVGSYVNGVPYGQGTMTYSDGRKLVGEFRHYAWDAILYDRDGRILGKFVEGKYIKE